MLTRRIAMEVVEPKEKKFTIIDRQLVHAGSRESEIFEPEQFTVESISDPSHFGVHYEAFTDDMESVPPMRFLHMDAVVSSPSFFVAGPIVDIDEYSDGIVFHVMDS